MHIKIVSLFLFIASAQAGSYLSEKPPYFNPCVSGNDFNSCFAGNFQNLFTHWKDGVPGLPSVGKIDPLLVKRVKIAHDASSALKLQLELRNVEVYGASGTVIKEISLDRKSWIMTAKVLIPKLRFQSDYKAKGQVLTLNLNGNGNAVFESENNIVAFRIKMKLRDENGFTFTEIDKVKINIDEIGSFHLQVDNLFGGQKELEESANQLFNENWRELYEIMRPAIEQTVEAIFQDRLQKTFHYVPANYFIGDLPQAKDVYG